MNKVVQGVIILAIGLALFDYVVDTVDASATAHPDFATLLNLIPTLYVLGIIGGAVAAFMGKLGGS